MNERGYGKIVNVSSISKIMAVRYPNPVMTGKRSGDAQGPCMVLHREVSSPSRDGPQRMSPKIWI